MLYCHDDQLLNKTKLWLALLPKSRSLIFCNINKSNINPKTADMVINVYQDWWNWTKDGNQIGNKIKTIFRKVWKMDENKVDQIELRFNWKGQSITVIWSQSHLFKYTGHWTCLFLYCSFKLELQIIMHSFLFWSKAVFLKLLKQRPQSMVTLAPQFRMQVELLSCLF